jgi:endo-1,4-beta-xylanase
MAEVYARETAIITADLELKWGRVHPRPDAFEFAGADALVAFCKRYDKKIRGHNLAWEESNPKWMSQAIDKTNAERTLVDHIKQVAGRYAGQIHSWDVVNEPIWPGHKQPDDMRDGLWLKALGPRYIDIAFHAAREADKSALLVLNEAATESNAPNSLRIRGAFLKLLDRLKRDRVPVDAVGLECHLNTDTSFDEGDFRDYLKTLSSRGYKLLITELDVADVNEPADVKVRDERVAGMYRRVVSTALANPDVIAVLTWELSDKYSWLRDPNNPPWHRRSDRSPLRPLPYDDAMQRKPCWTALAHAFGEAPKRQ